MAYRKHHVITMRRLNRGLDHVRSELDAHGFWTNQLAEIEVYLTWFGTAYGLPMLRDHGRNTHSGCFLLAFAGIVALYETGSINGFTSSRIWTRYRI